LARKLRINDFPDEIIFSFSESVLKNDSSFVEHRHDQSIFSLLKKTNKYKNTMNTKNNMIEFPSTADSEGLKSLTQQLITWKPNTRGKTDCVMALWFAVLRAREFMQQTNHLQKFSSNRWTTRAQSAQRYTINLDEAFSEQWAETYG
jgi:hypothetical protein